MRGISLRQRPVQREPDEFGDVYRRDATPLRLGLADTFAADDLLPGFSCKLADFFPD